MTAISKTTFTFTVLHPTDQPPGDLEQALEESDTGNAVGLVTAEVTTPVTDAAVVDELVALDNDGTFFDVELGRETE